MWLKWKRCTLTLGKCPSVASPVLKDHQIVELVQQYKHHGTVMSFRLRVDAVCKKKHNNMHTCTYITSFAVLMSKTTFMTKFYSRPSLSDFLFLWPAGYREKPLNNLRDLSEVRSLKAAWSILADPRPPSLAVWVCVVLPSGHRSKLRRCLQKVIYSCCYQACKWHCVIVFCVLYLSVFYDYLLLLAANQIALPWIIVIPWTFKMQRILIPSGKLWITRHLRPLRLPTLGLIALQDSRPQTFRIKTSMRTIIFQPFTPENLQRFSSVDPPHKWQTSGAFSIWDFLHFFLPSNI